MGKGQKPPACQPLPSQKKKMEHVQRCQPSPGRGRDRMRGEGWKGEREMKREGINLSAKVPESILRVPATLPTAAMVSFNTGITFLIAFPFVFLKHGIIDEIYFFK